MTCAKVRVYAVLTLKDGRRFLGENVCDNPQKKCPRKDGEGYAKCKSICAQESHAEVRAISLATVDRTTSFTGAHMVICHTHVCDNCRDIMGALGIRFTLVPPPSPIS